MPVPDQLRNVVLFVGLADTPRDQYAGTAFIVTMPGPTDNDFAFMMTAKHVAEHLQNNEFTIRVNRRCGGIAMLRGRPDSSWWFHPTERQCRNDTG
jgi:hypothetical protein